MIDARLTKTEYGYYDLKLTNGNFEMAEDGVEAAQHSMIRLLQYKGESVTDNPNDDGTDWYGIIFDMSKTRSEKELEIKRRILGTVGIEELVEFNFTQDGSEYTITGLVKSIWGDYPIEIGSTPL
jgi:hypothetical protein